MVKILSQSGMSLADIYNVEGSIAGVEQLESNEVSLVHEMGSTLFSERYVTNFVRMVSGDISQSTIITVLNDSLPVTPTRILGISVMVGASAMVRITHMTLSIRSVPGSDFSQDVPIWVFNAGNSHTIRILDNGVVGTFDLLEGVPQGVFSPNMMGGSGQLNKDMMSSLSLRGATNAFGAGTVEVTALIYMAFPFRGGISSRGLPIPSW